MKYPSSRSCQTCITVQSSPSCCTSTTSKNSGENAASCSSYCNTGCNCTCNSSNRQTICVAHSQYIKDHADVGSFTWGDNTTTDIQKDDFIHLKWSKVFWDDLIDKLNTAEKIGDNSSQEDNSGSYSVAKPTREDPIKYDFYNQIRTKLKNFNNIPSSYSAVEKNQLITATIANSLKKAFNDAKFNPNVCDLCNANEHSGGTCNCNCSCSCSCTCGCSCPCDCGCSCNCSCNCTCGCSCSSNK